MKGCELCSGVARVHCESDTANLCFGCDAKVHAANFLVARHERTLLCRTCQRPTPWRASGSVLGPTVSLCQRCCCVRGGAHKEEEDQEGESQRIIDAQEEQVVPAKNGAALKRTREDDSDLAPPSSSSSETDGNESSIEYKEATSESLRPLKSWKGDKVQFPSALQQSEALGRSESQPAPI